MGDEDFKQWVRELGLWFGSIMAAVVGIYLLIVAGWATHAYINQIDPDPPVCIHEQLCLDKYGAIVKCRVKYEADDAGHPINLSRTLEDPADAGK